MDHTRVSTGPSLATSMRPIVRRPGLVLAAFTVVGVAVGFRYQASKFRSNELAQKNSGSPNLYVSVERSGGGI
ncbi:hypothetical protein GQ53DRAFT_825290 [Thozetella sp. PMI_491]|nr:hypothetical protein GQ53DRAFT_825290 [Thozetella sp. PMI_491]